MRFRSSSYLLKLMVLSFLIGTVPVILLGTFAYYNASRTVQEKVDESNKLLLQQMQMRAEQTLRTIDNSATQLLQSPVVTGAFDKDISSRDFQLVHELYDGISRIQTYELGIRDVFLFSLNKNWIVSSGGVNEYSVPAFRPLLETFSRMPEGSFWTSGSEALPNALPSVYFVKKYPINAVNPTGIICVVLSTDVMKELDAFLNGKLGSAFILDRNANVIVDRDRTRLGSSMSEQLYLQPFLETKEPIGQYATKRDGEVVTVTYRKSAYNGWSYVSVTSNEQVNEQNKIIGWLTLLVCMAILLVTLLVAWFGSKKMYSPIRSIYSALASLPSPGDEGKRSGELQVIGERVDYLIRNQSLIMNELKGQQIQLKEFFMQKLFGGTIQPAKFEEKLSLYGLEEPWPSMCVIAIQIDTLKDTRYEEANRDLLMFAVSNIVGELVPAEQRLLPIVHADCQVTVIGSSKAGADFKEQIFNLSDEIQKAIDQYLEMKVSIGISRPFSSFAETQQALYEAQASLKYRVGLGQQSILFIEDVQPQKSNPNRYPAAGEQALLDAIRAGNAEQSELALKQFIGALFQPGARHRDYQLSLLRLLIGLLKFGQELTIPMDRIEEDEAALIQSLFKLRNVREIEHWFWSIFVDPYIRKLGTRRDSQFKHISEAVVDMIRREFDSALTLEECSSRINYHPHYVSRVFRQETGINFGEYLTQYRIDMAKKWLKESDLKIVEIAERLQYNNSANFIRSFRKTVGMTPGQFREEA
ncbi:helix-turn-helix domain-containing protein [Paenibacillus arenilitoris]|uniref:Helix-turn-helix domain-containing protein n=1 Tax=Paenibacillus arenilitoris TaxID=2772299 RepID=A0A927CI73_9BACL|nr:helix-turn-helix domain-containing protein [Paenibacillus arenilitoris]MBD2867127.1 helix-turn-helix domain-containing protein [Paenibacillus arenilitoris]